MGEPCLRAYPWMTPPSYDDEILILPFVVVHSHVDHVLVARLLYVDRFLLANATILYRF